MTTLVLTDPSNGTANDATLIASNNSAVKTVVNGNIDNANVKSAAAIAYSKLALSNSIVNADVASAAAIAYSKLNLTTSVKNGDLIASGGTLADTPPGRELLYTTATSPVSVTATTEGTATTVHPGAAFTFDGATPVLLEFYAPSISTAANGTLTLIFLDSVGSTSLGFAAVFVNPGGAVAWETGPIRASLRLTPSAAAHTFSVRGFRVTSNWNVNAGLGGAGAYLPMYIRITKV